MLYSQIKGSIDKILDEIKAGKEECYDVLSFNLIKDQNVPITVRVKLLYPLNQIKVTFFCPFLLVDSEVVYEEIFRFNVVEDELKLMKLISKFTTTLERLKSWIENEVPDMIRWGEGVIFDKNGRTKRIPFPASNQKSQKSSSAKI